MNKLPPQQQQVIQVHASLIRLVVDTISNPQLHPQLKESLNNLAEFWQRQVFKFEAFVFCIVILW